MIGFFKNILMIAAGLVAMGLGSALVKLIGILNLIGIAAGTAAYYMYFKSKHEQGLAISLSVCLAMAINLGVYAIAFASVR